VFGSLFLKPAISETLFPVKPAIFPKMPEIVRERPGNRHRAKHFTEGLGPADLG